MNDKINAFVEHVKIESANPDFVHHDWFVEWHLSLVERIAFELLDFYPDADRDLVRLMVWLHDYGKILDYDNQYATTLTAGKEKLLELGFEESFAQKAIDYIEILDRKIEVELREAPIEVQIVSSADGCSHMVGPFFSLWWHENPNKQYTDLMADNQNKLAKDWDRKIVLQEARRAFEARHAIVSEQTGSLPERFIS